MNQDEKPQPSTTFIYALLDENGVVRYVGKSNNPTRRLNDHLTKKSRSHKSHWIQSMLSRGVEPSLLIIEECPFEQWVERERYWIAYYDSVGTPLTNGTRGGDGLHYHQEKALRKISAIARQGKKKKRSPESIEKVASKNRGRKHTEQTRRNMSLAHMGHKPSPQTIEKAKIANKGKFDIPVLQYDRDGNFIRRWASMHEVEEHGVGQATLVCACIKGRRTTHANSIWRYESDPLPPNADLSQYQISHIAILQYDMYGNFIKRWASMKEVESAGITTVSSVVNCCKKRLKSSGGFRWYYEDDSQLLNPPTQLSLDFE